MGLLQMSDSTLVQHFSSEGMDSIAKTRAKPITPSKGTRKCKTQCSAQHNKCSMLVYNTTQHNNHTLQHNTMHRNTHMRANTKLRANVLRN